MQKFVVVAMAGLTTIASISPTYAFRYSPVSTHFKAVGTVLIQAGTTEADNCNVVISGQINAKGVGKITGVKLSGGQYGFCQNTTFNGSPWTVKAYNAQDGIIKGFSYSLSLSPYSSCGPGGAADFVINTPGQWSTVANLEPGCDFDGAGQITPTVSIVR